MRLIYSAAVRLADTFAPDRLSMTIRGENCNGQEPIVHWTSPRETRRRAHSVLKREMDLAKVEGNLGRFHDDHRLGNNVNEAIRSDEKWSRRY